MASETKRYLTAAQVRVRYQISPMTLHRWVKNPALDFPDPLVIQRRRLWNGEHLDRWDRDRLLATLPTPPRPGTPRLQVVP
jgi:hypothetical protein